MPNYPGRRASPDRGQLRRDNPGYRSFRYRQESGIPDQKGVLEMIRGLPDDYLFPGNNKVWHGTVALHFWFFVREGIRGSLARECGGDLCSKRGRTIQKFLKKKRMFYDGLYPSAWTSAIISLTCSSCFLVSFLSFWIRRPILTICNR